MIRRILGFAFLAFSVVAQAAAAPERPNFVLVLVDDAALMDFGVFGGEAQTPNIDELARRGMIFTQHRATPFCAPSRAMLLTGMDNHLAGLGTIREVLPPEHRGLPGYTMALEPGVETIATKLKRAGYRTYMTGKWHLGHEAGQLPIDHGFDRSFVLDASGADHWENKPYMPYYDKAPWFEDDKPAKLPDDFYSSTFIAGQMRKYLEEDADRSEPFFAYVAFLAVHIPVQAPRAYTEKYLKTYEGGWDDIREKRWRRAQELGLIPEGAALAEQPKTIPRWQNLDPDQKKLASKSMAVNAGALDAMDHELGQLIAYLKESGQFDNTVFIVTSDNGPEAGDPWGREPFQWWYELQEYERNYETLGEKNSYVALGAGGASAAAGPSHLFKFHAAEGGLRVPLVMSGPGFPQGGKADAFTTLADIAPTILDLANFVEPPSGAKPFTGKSMTPVLRGEAEYVHGPDEAIVFSTSSQIALYRGRHKLVRNLPPHGDSTWRLFDLSDDPGETRDLSASLPDVKRQLMHEYRVYANRIGILELPDGYNSTTQIAKNSIEKLWRLYWPWIALAFATLAATVALAVWGALRLVRLARSNGVASTDG